MRLAVLFLVGMTGSALAEHEAAFAKTFGARTSDVAEHALPGGLDMTHVVIGRYEDGAYTMAAALLRACTPDCDWRRIEFGAADAVEVVSVIDLHGAPGALPSRASRGRLAGPRGMKFPALVIRARESKPTKAGTELRAKLYVISLVDADRGAVVWMDTAEQRPPRGRGFTRSYRLDKPDPKAIGLDIIASDDQRCSEPAEMIWALEDRHYRTKKATLGKGC